MNIKFFFIATAFFVFFLLAFYFVTNLTSFDRKSNDCEGQGGQCVKVTEGCGEGLMSHPDAECQNMVNNKVIIDDSKICCISY